MALAVFILGLWMTVTIRHDDLHDIIERKLLRLETQTEFHYNLSRHPRQPTSHLINDPWTPP